MTTATAPATRDLVEVQPPELVKLTEAGSMLGGKLLAIEPVTIEGDVTIEYIIQRDTDHKVVKLRTSADLKQKITDALIGKYVLIEFVGLDQSVGTEKGNAMKRFKVLTEK